MSEEGYHSDSWESALHKAVAAGDFEAVDQLLEENDVNTPDLFGDTPLHVAVRKQNIPMIEHLVHKGANLLAVNLLRLSPLDYALMTHDPDVEIAVNYFTKFSKSNPSWNIPQKR